MWTVKPAPIPVQFLSYSHPPPCNHHDGFHRRFYNLRTKSQTSESESIGVLGQQILLRSNESNQNKPVSKKEKEISGSDVLWAIQRATAQRKKSNADKKTKKMMMSGVEVLSSTVESTGDNGEDYGEVTPLRIKSDWGERLENFEKVLQEIQETEV